MLPTIRLHDLRHTHATLALQAGIHPKVVSERLGHATVSITLDTYSHAIPAMQEEAAALIAGLVFAEQARTPPVARSRILCVMRSSRRRRRAGLTAIKTVHTLAWLSIESCMAYVLYAGLARRSDRRAAIAAAVVAGESLIFVGNRCRCPLTQVAEQLGAEQGSVTDIYLPDWFAK